MKKQKMNLWLLAALLCGMSLSVTSCKDDDNSQSAEEQLEQALELQNQTTDAYAVIDELANTDETTIDDFLTETFEPTIGLADSGDEGTRIVSTNTMQAAAQRFAQLANVSIDETTQSYTWSNALLGTMTYQKSQDGKAWATVDVDIKQVPHLHKIIYRAPGQADDNTSGNFSGRAYYRFGDVVSRKVTDKLNTITEYWVCVRPSFSLEGKGDSHWVCLNALPKKNILEYSYTVDESVGKQTWRVPTGLGKSEEHMQNLAEMLFAMLHPKDWQANIQSKDKPDLPMFHDFDKTKVDYHNQNFWQNVCDGWDRTKVNGQSLWECVFNTTKGGLQEDFDNPNVGLHLLYNGYSWYYRLKEALGGWNCQFWEAIYTKGTGNQSNMHSVSLIEPMNSMKNVYFDCRTMGDAKKNYIGFFENDDIMRFCIRHALGKELVKKGGKYDVRSKIDGVEDVYRYYRDVNPTDAGQLLNEQPEKTGSRYGEHGAISPGTVLEDSNGDKWVCYADWQDDALCTTADHKARFISFQHLRDGLETVKGAASQGLFYTNDDLVPESEAPVCALVLASLTRSTTDALKMPFSTMRQILKEKLGVSIERWETRRDSTLTYKDVVSDGFVFILNLAYRPEGGRAAGTQPYLRCILDESGMGNNRLQLPASMRNPRLRFFKYYNDGGTTLLDLTHSFQASGFITAEKPVKYDAFSHLMRPDTKQRDGDFTLADAYSGTYATESFMNNPAEYVTPYREKVLIVRYMELDDPSEGIQSTYNGKPFKVIHKPTAEEEQQLRYHLATFYLSSGYNPGGGFNWCTMDGKAYNLNYHTKNSLWPTADSWKE